MPKICILNPYWTYKYWKMSIVTNWKCVDFLGTKIQTLLSILVQKIKFSFDVVQVMKSEKMLWFDELFIISGHALMLGNKSRWPASISPTQRRIDGNCTNFANGLKKKKKKRKEMNLFFVMWYVDYKMFLQTCQIFGTTEIMHKNLWL